MEEDPYAVPPVSDELVNWRQTFLKKVRDERDMSAAEMADRIGTTARTLQAIAAEDSLRFKPHLRDKLLKLIGLSREEVVPRAEETCQTVSPTSATHTAHATGESLRRGFSFTRPVDAPYAASLPLDRRPSAASNCEHVVAARHRSEKTLILLAPRDVEGLLAEHQTFATPTAGAGLEQRLRAKLADWRGLLTQNVESGREVLRSLLVGPLRFTPVNEARRVGYAFEGSIALDRLVSGVIELVPRTGVASPTGLAPFSVVNGSVVRPAAETRLFGNGRAAAACLDAAANQPLKDRAASFTASRRTPRSA